MSKIIRLSFYSFLLLALVATGSCKKTETTPPNQTFSYTETIHSACVDSYTGSPDEKSFENDITTVSVQQAFLSQGRTYDPAKIVSAKLQSLKAIFNSSTSSSCSNLDEISTIKVYVGLAGAINPVQIAHAENIAAGATSVYLTVDNTAELKGNITQLSTLTVKIATKGSNPFAHTCIDFSQGVVQVEVKP